MYDLTEFVNGGDAEWNKDDFIDAAWDVCTYEDKVYSIPFTYSSTFLFYNKDMLAEAGWEEFPKTMDELIQCIDDCTKVGADGSIEQMGLIPDYPWLDNVLWPVAFGAQFIDEETNTITFDSPEMLKAYQFQADIYSKYGYDNVKRFIDSLGARATTEDPLFTGKLAIRWQADSALASSRRGRRRPGHAELRRVGSERQNGERRSHAEGAQEPDQRREHGLHG